MRHVNFNAKITFYRECILEIIVPHYGICKHRKNEMKVLYIATADYKYGAAKSLVDMMMALREKHDVIPVVLTKRHNPLNEMCDDMGIENYSYWYRDIMAGSAYSRKILNLMKHIVKYVLFLFGGVTQHGINRCGLPMDEIDIIHTNLNRLDIGIYLAKKYHKKHVCHLRELNVGHSRIVMYKRNCYQYLNEGVDKFIAISEITRKSWVECGLNASKVVTIYNGVENSLFQDKTYDMTMPLRIVMVGRIEENKGQMQLVQALTQLEPGIRQAFTVDFIGEGYEEYKNRIISAIHEYDLNEQVVFKGYMDDIPTQLSKYDIGIVASKGEAFGRVTAEYMQAGLLTIASDTGANSELVDENINGMLYRYADSSDLACKLKEVYENSELLAIYGRAAREKAQQQFSITRCAREIYELYQKL